MKQQGVDPDCWIAITNGAKSQGMRAHVRPPSKRHPLKQSIKSLRLFQTLPDRLKVDFRDGARDGV